MRRLECPVVLFTLVVSLGLSLAAAWAGTAGRDGRALEALFRGMEARDRRILTFVKSMKGEWEVRRRYRERRPGDPAAPKDPRERRLIEETAKQTMVFEGEKYRESEEAVDARDRRRGRMTGYDGAVEWRSALDPATGAWGSEQEVVPNPATVWELGAHAFTGLIGLGRDEQLASSLRAHRSRLVREDVVAGHVCYVIETRFSDTTGSRVWTTWVCPDYGDAVVRRDRSVRLSEPWGPVTGGGGSTVYSDFAMFAQGVWLPRKYTSTSSDKLLDGARPETSFTEAGATQLEVNVPIAAELFQMPSNAGKAPAQAK